MPKLFPGAYVNSTYNIDFKALAAQGYRGVLFDVDNTLVPHGAPADDRAIALFAELNQLGFQAALLSNNKEPRVKSFCEQVRFATYIFKACKPKAAAYLKATADMGLEPGQVIFVGDQIFTDIWGANNAGIRSVLVRPIIPFREEIQIIFKRFLEAIVLLAYLPYSALAKGAKEGRIPTKG